MGCRHAAYDGDGDGDATASAKLCCELMADGDCDDDAFDEDEALGRRSAALESLRPRIRGRPAALRFGESSGDRVGMPMAGGALRAADVEVPSCAGSPERL